MLRKLMRIIIKGIEALGTAILYKISKVMVFFSILAMIGANMSPSVAMQPVLTFFLFSLFLMAISLGAAHYLTVGEVTDSVDRAGNQVTEAVEESSTQEKTAMDTLKEKFAEGEISEEEFKKKKELLED